MGGGSRGEKRPHLEQVVRSVRPDALLLPTRVLGAFTIRFALNEHARANGRLLATSENIATTIMLRGNGSKLMQIYSNCDLLRLFLSRSSLEIYPLHFPCSN